MMSLQMMSLRTRVLLIAIGLLAVGLVVGGAVAIGALEHYLVGRIDGQLRPLAAVGARIRVDQTALVELAASRPNPVDGFLGNVHFVYLRADGTVDGAFRQPQQSAVRPSLPLLDTAAVAERAGVPFEVPSEGGQGRWRAIAIPDKTVPGSSVVVAASLDEVDATIAQLRAIFLITGGSLLALLTGVGWFAIRAGLRPLRRIEETSAAIARGDLGSRVPDLAGPRTEVGRVAAALNTMLARNEAAFAARADSEARMRRFVADASHELRTPLVGIKGFTKLYRMGAMPDREDVDEAMSRIERESQRLTALVEDLLVLGQADRGFSLDPAPMDLRTLAVDALHDVRALDPSRPVELTGPDGGPPACAPTIADEARLRQVVSNLVGNAVTHTPAGTPIRIGVGTQAGSAVLEVADQGPGLTPAQAQRVFDRFYRADTSRSRNSGGGTGLGLAIVHSLVAAHGGRVDLQTSPGHGATFRVLLPAQGPRSPG